MKFKQVIDLTHTMSADMPVYPGASSPRFEAILDFDFQVTQFEMGTHTGTHMDAPGHMFPGKRTTLDQFPASQFCGTALVIDCTGLKAGDRITMELINRVKDKADQAEFILFNTGWSKYWGSPEYFGDFPYFDDEVMEYLKSSKKKGVGVDVISIDPIADSNFTIHRKLFADAEIVVIENLKNLDKLGGEPVAFFALPLKYTNSEGAPIRAIAVIED
jgi:kynurenine formamidase